MADLIPRTTILTPPVVTGALLAAGLDVFGATIPALSTAWSMTTPGALADATLRLRLTGPLAPFTGFVQLESSPVQFSTVTGSPVTTPALVVRLHPEAARRLDTLLAWRTVGAGAPGGATGAPFTEPVPVAMLVHGVTMPGAPQAVRSVEAGEQLDTGTFDVSFHDDRGLPIDPVAVATLFADLARVLGGLVFGDAAMPAVGSAGGLTAITALAGTVTTRCQVIDPHGTGYIPVGTSGRLRVLGATGAALRDIPDGGLIDLAAGETIGRTAADLSADQTAGTVGLRWGWSRRATLARTLLTPPAAPPVGRRFVRVTAVDMDWHLLGNRSTADVQGVPKSDGTIPAFLTPVVRHQCTNFALLPTGIDVLGAVSQIASGFGSLGTQVGAAVCSPVIDATVAMPPVPGLRWPTFPGATPIPATQRRPALRATGAVVATRRAAADGPGTDRDVVVTFAGDVLPAGMFVRVFPRQFVPIASIGETTSFVRGDGGAAIANTGSPTQVLLVNPFGLGATDTFPDSTNLIVDVVTVADDFTRMIVGSVTLPLGNPVSFAANPAGFGGTAALSVPAIAALLTLPGATSDAPVSLFGIPATAPVSNPTGLTGLVRSLASESTAPRRGPRLPTQARFETIVAFGSAAAPGTALAWQAVTSGARLTTESRAADLASGNPGNPAGPDVIACGVRTDGLLAYDIALHAIKRAQPVLPLPAPVTAGWVISTAGDNYDTPAPDTAGTVSAVMLETVAAFVDSPELAALAVPDPGDSLQGLLNAAATSLGVPAPTLNNNPRITRQLQREVATARSGQRDALWSLNRAFRQAREYVLIMSPQLAVTSRSQPSIPDLVDVLKTRLTSNPRLKLIVCLPTHPDAALAKGGWVRAAFAHRTAALKLLTEAAPGRVAAFHPSGFPGRTAVIRSTVAIVDDVYAMVGTSHLRRRGVTFDGALDVATMDTQLDERGVSATIAAFRQRLLAELLAVPVPAGPLVGNALWTRLASPEGSFDVVRDLLASAGNGRVSPVWGGPTDTTVLPQTDSVADPDGATLSSAALFSLFASLLVDP